MTLRDMTPDELELFEEEIVQGRDEPVARREPDKPGMARRGPAKPEVEREDGEREEDRDGDGLPDGPFKQRVPS